MRKGSGGSGQVPGRGRNPRDSTGSLRDSHVSLITERRERSPWGARGGEDGASGEETRSRVGRRGEKTAREVLYLRKGRRSGEDPDSGREEDGEPPLPRLFSPLTLIRT